MSKALQITATFSVPEMNVPPELAAFLPAIPKEVTETLATIPLSPIQAGLIQAIEQGTGNEFNAAVKVSVIDVPDAAPSPVPISEPASETPAV